MKIVGIGTDIVSTSRIKTIWDRFGSAFARRILAKSELTRLELSRDPVSFLAKRYAAKEAVAKALGTGFRPEGILLTEISVNNNALGRPYLEFSGEAEREMARLRVVESHLTLSDEKEFAVAFVVLVGE
ncbi:MAG TPA: holo-ACP synthase [Gammaproteobacteria bacterium]|nr:holo-ACP synthase [Gammaproteobacteria bacterium]